MPPSRVETPVRSPTRGVGEGAAAETTPTTTAPSSQISPATSGGLDRQPQGVRGLGAGRLPVGHQPAVGDPLPAQPTSVAAGSASTR